jgi:hypothetical protein
VSRASPPRCSVATLPLLCSEILSPCGELFAPIHTARLLSSLAVMRSTLLTCMCFDMRKLFAHRRICLSFSHPGYFGKVGMRYFHKNQQKFFCPNINVEKLWTLTTPEVCYDCYHRHFPFSVSVSFPFFFAGLGGGGRYAVSLTLVCFKGPTYMKHTALPCSVYHFCLCASILASVVCRCGQLPLRKRLP